MTGAPAATYRNLFLFLAAIVLVLGAMAAMDLANGVYLGFRDDGNNKVSVVDANSPATTAGMRVGDVFKSVNGIAITNAKGLADMPRLKAGATLPLVIERGGQTLNLQFTPAPLRDKDVYLARARIPLGLCFLFFTLWAYFAAPGAATTLLACFGLSVGSNILGMPYFESPAARMAAESIGLVIAVLGLAAFLHFLLTFPARRPILERASGTKIVYGPAVVLAVLFSCVIVFQPPATSTLNVAVRTLFSVVFAGYFIAGIVVLVRRFVAATASEREAHGLGLMLAGGAVGLAPTIANFVLLVLRPGAALPLYEYYFLTLGFIPITFAIATVRSARAAAAAAT